MASAAASSRHVEPRADLFILEFIVNLRWALHYVTDRLDPTVESHYPQVLTDAREMEEVLAACYANVASLGAVPVGALEMAREGIVYLLLAEGLLESCPPTMHAFLLRASTVLSSVASARSADLSTSSALGSSTRQRAAVGSTGGRQGPWGGEFHVAGDLDLNSSTPSTVASVDTRTVASVDDAAVFSGSGPGSAKVTSTASQAMLLLVRWLTTERIVLLADLQQTLHVDGPSPRRGPHPSRLPFEEGETALGSVRGSGRDSHAGSTEFAEHGIMAARLAQLAPFYLGAHVLVTRSLLLYHTCSLVQLEDVVAHSRKLAQPLSRSAAARVMSTATTLESALLQWMRTALALVEAGFTTETVNNVSPSSSSSSSSSGTNETPAGHPAPLHRHHHRNGGHHLHRRHSAQPLEQRALLRAVRVACRVSDFSAAVENGCAVCVTLHYYQPGLLPLDDIAFPEHVVVRSDAPADRTHPSSGTQRRRRSPRQTRRSAPQSQYEVALRNWTLLLHRCEVLGIAPSVTAEEVTRHGRSALPLHVLRLVQELFAVVATHAEENLRVSIDLDAVTVEAEEDAESLPVRDRTFTDSLTARTTVTSAAERGSVSASATTSRRQGFPRAGVLSEFSSHLRSRRDEKAEGTVDSGAPSPVPTHHSATSLPSPHRDTEAEETVDAAGNETTSSPRAESLPEPASVEASDACTHNADGESAYQPLRPLLSRRGTAVGGGGTPLATLTGIETQRNSRALDDDSRRGVQLAAPAPSHRVDPMNELISPTADALGAVNADTSYDGPPLGIVSYSPPRSAMTTTLNHTKDGTSNLSKHPSKPHHHHHHHHNRQHSSHKSQLPPKSHESHESAATVDGGTNPEDLKSLTTSAEQVGEAADHAAWLAQAAMRTPPQQVAPFASVRQGKGVAEDVHNADAIPGHHGDGDTARDASVPTVSVSAAAARLAADKQQAEELRRRLSQIHQDPRHTDEAVSATQERQNGDRQKHLSAPAEEASPLSSANAALSDGLCSTLHNVDSAKARRDHDRHRHLSHHHRHRRSRDKRGADHSTATTASAVDTSVVELGASQQVAPQVRLFSADQQDPAPVPLPNASALAPALPDSAGAADLLQPSVSEGAAPPEDAGESPEKPSKVIRAKRRRTPLRPAPVGPPPVSHAKKPSPEDTIEPVTHTAQATPPRSTSSSSSSGSSAASSRSSSSSSSCDTRFSVKQATNTNVPGNGAHSPTTRLRVLRADEEGRESRLNSVAPSGDTSADPRQGQDSSFPVASRTGASSAFALTSQENEDGASTVAAESSREPLSVPPSKANTAGTLAQPPRPTKAAAAPTVTATVASMADVSSLTPTRSPSPSSVSSDNDGKTREAKKATLKSSALIASISTPPSTVLEDAEVGRSRLEAVDESFFSSVSQARATGIALASPQAAARPYSPSPNAPQRPRSSSSPSTVESVLQQLLQLDIATLAPSAQAALLQAVEQQQARLRQLVQRPRATAAEDEGGAPLSATPNGLPLAPAEQPPAGETATAATPTPSLVRREEDKRLSAVSSSLDRTLEQWTPSPTQNLRTLPRAGGKPARERVGDDSLALSAQQAETDMSSNLDERWDSSADAGGASSIRHR